MSTFFSDFFNVDPEAIERHGAFNISLINDLPLFVDPFLLFHSDNSEYNNLHDEIIKYLQFLRDRSLRDPISEGLLRSWYCFPEVKQNWLGFSVSGNRGSGLGIDFAKGLHENLGRIFQDFGRERVTRGSHLEKISLIQNGIGRDNISDFTTNLIKEYLCRYTERFAKESLHPEMRRRLPINRARFNYRTESWQTRYFELPYISGDYVLLTPKDILTRDDTWINRSDLIAGFDQLPAAIPDAQLRAEVCNYFERLLARTNDRAPSNKDREEAAARTILQFPTLIDHYIRLKEDTGDEAADLSNERVISVEFIFNTQLRELQHELASATPFYKTGKTTYDESHERVRYLKETIENRGGHRLFYHDGEPIEREKDLQILFRLVWFGTPSDVTAEANDGRGPVDYKISRGAKDKTLVEMKLAKNSHLERNLQKQAQVYQKASDAPNAIKVIIFFTRAEQERVEGIIDRLGLTGHRDVILIDARDDNKPSGSRA